MKTTSGITTIGLALGILAGPASYEGRAVAQQTSIDGHLQEATAPAEGNGAQPGDSHVRIVRLSDVKGSLALDRKTGHGFEQTMQNMPIVEGEKLQTSDGYAEVEFEDNSTFRLTPNSQVDFSLLALRGSGAKASTMNVVRGTVYVSLESTKGNEFLLIAGEAKMTVKPSTHLRMQVDGLKTVISVFSGDVEVQRAGETTLVAKKESLTLDNDQVSVAKKIAAESYDAWDKDSNNYHARYSRANAFAGSGNTYGLSDLNYYGNFINAGGFGQIWQPYLIGSGWSPYSNGLWALYPGAGYSWVSPYPWGWLPYHSGTWTYYPTYGWGWQPGNNWSGLNNTAASGVQPVGTQVHAPLRQALLPQAPVASTTKSSLVLANQSPMVFSGQDKEGSFVFQKGSAGLGVPRGSLGDLNRISNHVEQHGSASMQVYGEPVGGRTTASGNGTNRGPVVLRQGSPSESASVTSQQGTFGGNTGGQPYGGAPLSTSSRGPTSIASGSSGGASHSSGSPK